MVGWLLSCKRCLCWFFYAHSQVREGICPPTCLLICLWQMWEIPCGVVLKYRKVARTRCLRSQWRRVWCMAEGSPDACTPLLWQGRRDCATATIPDGYCWWGAFDHYFFSIQQRSKSVCLGRCEDRGGVNHPLWDCTLRPERFWHSKTAPCRDW